MKGINENQQQYNQESNEIYEAVFYFLRNYSNKKYIIYQIKGI